MRAMLRFANPERRDVYHIYGVSRLMNFGITKRRYSVGDVLSIRVFEYVFPFRKLHLADVGGSFCRSRDKKIYLNTFIFRRFAIPAVRRSVLLDSKCIDQLWHMFYNQQFKSVPSPSVKGFAPLHGAPGGEAGIFYKTQVEQGNASFSRNSAKINNIYSFWLYF